MEKYWVCHAKWYDLAFQINSSYLLSYPSHVDFCSYQQKRQSGHLEKVWSHSAFLSVSETINTIYSSPSSLPRARCLVRSRNPTKTWQKTLHFIHLLITRYDFPSFSRGKYRRWETMHLDPGHKRIWVWELGMEPRSSYSYSRGFHKRHSPTCLSIWPHHSTLGQRTTKHKWGKLRAEWRGHSFPITPASIFHISTTAVLQIQFRATLGSKDTWFRWAHPSLTGHAHSSNTDADAPRIWKNQLNPWTQERKSLGVPDPRCDDPRIWENQLNPWTEERKSLGVPCSSSQEARSIFTVSRSGRQSLPRWEVKSTYDHKRRRKRHPSSVRCAQSKYLADENVSHERMGTVSFSFTDVSSAHKVFNDFYRKK